VHLLAEFNGIIGILNGFETHELAALSGLIYVTPIYAAWDDFVVGLEENAAIAEIIEERVDSRLDV